MVSSVLTSLFLSTPSARRATLGITPKGTDSLISIHALREEGDQKPERQRILQKHFYPRPPRGGRLVVMTSVPLCLSISIHALREEGDLLPFQYNRTDQHFYPRPPRGGRPPPKCRTCCCRRISIHALREEGDGFCKYTRSNVVTISIHALREEGDFTTQL